MIILDKINQPEDVRKLTMSELEQLCSEIREYIVRCCSENPGHLASSLGAVELIVAMHYVFDTPQDKLVFDVGHQAYAHKLLTGRREAFKRNRKADGISGFPFRDESDFDVFGAGHASTSISAALGIAEAARLQGKQEKVVAMIGDGAMSGGLALEGLNNAGDSNADLLVILNDNEMAIDRNQGAVHEYLMKVTTSTAYNKAKKHVWDRLGSGKFRDWMQNLVHKMKSSLVTRTGGNLFEAFGFRYFGPIDGNNLQAVVDALRRLKKIGGPRLLHTYTVKGKGYAPAEADPTTWHAPGRFDPESGERTAKKDAVSLYQDVFGEVLCELAKLDPKVVGITPAMATGSGMTRFASEFKDRFFDVGIAEEHAVTFSAGLAAGGLKPYCVIYSTFAQRAYDEFIHDVALQHLPVVLCLDRAGLVGEDGATHQGAFDLASYRCIPNVTISAPKDEVELKQLLYTGLRFSQGPFIIRYPRGRGEGTPWREIPFREYPVGKGEKLLDGEKVAVLALGPVANRALEAARRLKNETGMYPAVFNMRFLKPIDTAILEEASRFARILTLEDGSLKGGLFGEVSEYLSTLGHRTPLSGIGIPDRFIKQATQAEQLKMCSLDRESLYSEISRLMKK
jgi:1-deoxy-D-xylulose-5-phosphate synthase